MRHAAGMQGLLRSAAIALSFGLAISRAADVPAAQATAQGGETKLAVLISIDQCRADYLVRFRPFFGQDGFNRLFNDGLVFAECHQRHAVTNTAPGHATIATGVHANVHGIISNEWRDRDSGLVAAAVEDPEAPLVGLMAAPWRSPGGVLEKKSGRSPRRMLAPTIGDQLKLRYLNASRVISISVKDRQAILLGGRLADGAYWLDGAGFVTSTFYRDRLPGWVEDFNRAEPVAAKFGATWDRLLKKEEYDRLQGPDDAAGEESRLGLGVTFPRRLDGGAATLGGKYFEAFRLTPYVADVTLELVKRGVVAERLGRHEAPDLLCIGFPQIDYAGHSYGPDSHEVMDLIVRLDGVIAELLKFLDTEVGAGKYVVALTADHGVTPLPERVNLLGRDLGAGRFKDREITEAVEQALVAKFGAAGEGQFWAARDSYGIRFTRAVLEARHVAVEDAAVVAKQILLKQPQIAEVYTAAEVQAAVPSDQTVIGRVALSYHRERSQDVLFVLQPFIVDRSPAGTNHGGPYDHDDHVPLCFFGAGVKHGLRTERVGVDQVAPTLAGLLQVPPPPAARGTPLF